MMIKVCKLYGERMRQRTERRTWEQGICKKKISVTKGEECVRRRAKGRLRNCCRQNASKSDTRRWCDTLKNSMANNNPWLQTNLMYGLAPRDKSSIVTYLNIIFLWSDKAFVLLFLLHTFCPIYIHIWHFIARWEDAELLFLLLSLSRLCYSTHGCRGWYLNLEHCKQCVESKILRTAWFKNAKCILNKLRYFSFECLYLRCVSFVVSMLIHKEDLCAMRLALQYAPIDISISIEYERTCIWCSGRNKT